jgi:hypothetical protein
VKCGVDLSKLAHSSISVDQFYKMAAGTRSSVKAKAQIEKEMKGLTEDLDTVGDDVQIGPDDEVRGSESRRGAIDADVVVNTKEELSDSDGVEQEKSDSVDADRMTTLFERLLSKYDLVKKESVSPQKVDRLTRAEATAVKSVRKTKSPIEETSEESEDEEEVKPVAKRKAEKVPSKSVAGDEKEQKKGARNAREIREKSGKTRGATTESSKVKAARQPDKQRRDVDSDEDEQESRWKGAPVKSKSARIASDDSEVDVAPVKPRKTKDNGAKSKKHVKIREDSTDEGADDDVVKKSKTSSKKEKRHKTRKVMSDVTDGETSDDVSAKKGRKVKGKKPMKAVKKRVVESTDSESDEETSSDTTSDDGSESDRRGRSERGGRKRERQPKELTMDCFTGKSTDTPVGTFLAQFKVVAKQNGWRESQWAYELVAKLRGEARALILPEEDSEVPSFKRVVKMLKRHFGGDEDPETYEGMLQAKTRESKETIRELEQWVRVTGRRAYPEITDAKALNRMLKRDFLDALPNEDQRVYVKRAEPKNLSEAARAAIRWEAINKSELVRKQLRGGKVRVQLQETSVIDGESETNPAKSQKKRQQDKKPAEAGWSGLTEEGVALAIRRALVAEGVVRQQPSGGDVRTPGGLPPPRPRPQQGDAEQGRPPAACYRCKKEGHFAYECPEIWCYRCTRPGHLARSCTYAAFCNHCRVEGHTYKDCTVRAARADGREQGNQDGASRSGPAGPPPARR